MYRYPRPLSTPFSPYAPYHHAWHPYQYAPPFPSYLPIGHQQHTAVSPYPAPYPKPGPLLTPPSPGIQSLMAQFKKSDGTYDINKMMNTMGQMINTVNQVNGVLKGLINTFKK
ncbi:spore coat protein [Geobacillus sp. NFOSA3]|uniref:YppG family protein n=1 Tax=Parageobacillus toebii TaxID=153151 RepID=UPI0009BE3FD5|nr:YppG family protein [Parageobacillus toebii]NNU92305.1 spore coat protein [Geobacillus sp. NFOSA3]OQO99797.1 spore coat protein [Geobacillus sp. 44C]MED4989669.1 YppG family protein [Parageobacillus toebii]QNU34815.1 YppG family protein [Geobacillus sp. 44C]QSB47373.1 YppG family protein [Parageobacillus toebii]